VGNTVEQFRYCEDGDANGGDDGSDGEACEHEGLGEGSRVEGNDDCGHTERSLKISHPSCD